MFAVCTEKARSTRVIRKHGAQTWHGSLVDRLSMVPCEADPCPSYRPSGPYRTALEVPAGGFDDVAELRLER